MDNYDTVEARDINMASDNYTKKRLSLYPGIQEQLDQMYWDKINGTSVWSDYITNIKEFFPKPEE